MRAMSSLGVPLSLLDAISQWDIRILKSRECEGFGIYVGVASSDISHDCDNPEKPGCSFTATISTLFPGSLHGYSGKLYVSRKKDRKSVPIGNTITVVTDTTEGIFLLS